MGLFAGTRFGDPQTAHTFFRAFSRQSEYRIPGSKKAIHATSSIRMLPGVNDLVWSIAPQFVQTTDCNVCGGKRPHRT